jgi:primosomal replication protein N
LSANRLWISGQVTELNGLRYTPAGVPVLEFVLSHQGAVQEAGLSRDVQCEVPVMVMGDVALMWRGLTLGLAVQVQGFIAPMRKSSPRLRLHADQIQAL